MAAESLSLRPLHHLHHGQRLAIREWNDDAFDLYVTFQAVQRDAGESRAHLQTVEACCAGGVFNGGEDQGTEALSGEVGMNEDSAHLSGVGCWVEQLGFTAGAAVCAEESLAFGPSTAACQPLSVDGFCDKVGAIRNELCVDAQDGAERAFDLRGRIVVRLQAPRRGFNQRVQGPDVSFGGEA